VVISDANLLAGLLRSSKVQLLPESPSAAPIQIQSATLTHSAGNAEGDELLELSQNQSD
jgi:hypothetical protein